MSGLASHERTILAGIIGLFIGLLLGIAVTVNERPATGYTVNHLAVHGMSHISASRVSRITLSPTADCTAYTPIVHATDNLDIDITGNSCLYRAGMDYPGKAGLLIVLIDKSDHARAIASWQGSFR